MAILHSEAIILRRHRFSESSLVASALTREHGRVDFLAKGCLREKSPLFGHLDHYQREAVTLIERPQAGLALLIEAAFVDEHAGLRFFAPSFAAAGFAAELTLASCLPGDPQQGLFDSLARGFGALAALGEPAAKAGLAAPSGLSYRDRGLLAGSLFRRLILETLAWLGFQPEVGRCVRCGGPPAASGNALSRRHGGLLCASCRGRAGGGAASGAVLAALQAAVSGSDYDEFALTDKERRELLRFLVDYSQYAVEKRLHSAAALLQLLPANASFGPAYAEARPQSGFSTSYTDAR